MWLSELEIKDIRNLREVHLDPAPGMNVLWGANGSGKSSVLEAIHLLGLGRSFQSSQARAYIHHGEQRAWVFGRTRFEGGERRLGIEKDVKGRTEIRIDGQRAESAAQLAEYLPLVLFTPHSQVLVEGGPGERRSYLDWGLFHVEHQFLSLWRRYQRSLKQRNAALGMGENLGQWDEAVATTGEQLSSLRRSYLQTVTEPFQVMLGLLAPELGRFTLEYLPGWPGERLLDALIKSRERDIKEGFTSVGPHRAEVRIRTSGRLAAAVLSRGQEKLMVAALRLAQLDHLKAATGKTAIVLIDDLPAELDRAHRRLFLEALTSLDEQVFVTATDADLLDTQEIPVQMFHVEHGQVRPVL